MNGTAEKRWQSTRKSRGNVSDSVVQLMWPPKTSFWGDVRAVVALAFLVVAVTFLAVCS